jgi:hypothetical protein
VAQPVLLGLRLMLPELLKLELRVALTVGVAEVVRVLFPLVLWL